MNVNDLLDRARALTGSPHDKALAQRLGVTQPAISNWRCGRALPDVVMCEKLAEICGFPPLRVIAAINEQRAISQAEKRVWRRLATAALLVTFGLSCALPAAAHSLGMQIM